MAAVGLISASQTRQLLGAASVRLVAWRVAGSANDCLPCQAACVAARLMISVWSASWAATKGTTGHAYVAISSASVRYMGATAIMEVAAAMATHVSCENTARRPILVIGDSVRHYVLVVAAARALAAPWGVIGGSVALICHSLSSLVAL